MNKLFKRQLGMTMVEVLLSMAILSIGVLAILRGLYFAQNSIDKGSKNNAIFRINQSYVDQIRSMSGEVLEEDVLPTLTLQGVDSPLTVGEWNDVPEAEISSVAPGAGMQIRPDVDTIDNEYGKRYLITVDYRWTQSLEHNPDSSSWKTVQIRFNKAALLASGEASSVQSLPPRLDTNHSPHPDSPEIELSSQHITDPAPPWPDPAIYVPSSPGPGTPTPPIPEPPLPPISGPPPF